MTDAGIQSAWEAHHAGDKGEALVRWEAVRRESPEQILGHWGVATIAREIGQIAYSSEVIERALKRFPSDPFVISAAAQTSSAMGDWAASVELWEKIIDAPNVHPLSIQFYAESLLAIGEFEKLEWTLRDARVRFPDHRGFLGLRAMLAEARQNFDESLALWSEFRKLFPDDPMVWDNYGRVNQKREFARIDHQVASDDLDPAVKVGVIDDEELCELMTTFVNLGSTCEFGLVQRRFGAEPLGLLRFNVVNFGGLVSALAHRFQDMGSPATTELVCASNGEYYLRDRRWGLAKHTFIFRGQQEPEVIYTEMCRRWAYLKRLMLSELTQAEKVFVFVSPDLTGEDLSTLHLAMKSIGPATLLHARPLSAQAIGMDTGSAGEVRKLETDLFVGFLNRLGNGPGGSWNIAFEEWVAICRAVRNATGGSKTSSACNYTP